MPVHPLRRSTRLAVLVAVVGLSAAAGCDQAGSVDPPPSDTAPEPGIDTYVSAIASIVGEPDPAPDEPPDPLPVLFLVPLAEPMSIDDQATVIETFSASRDVRFVDELAAAVDAELPERPPRDDAIVLGLGPIDPEPPHLLRIEQYHSATDVEATRLTLAYVVDHWVVAMTEPVPAEALTNVE